MAGAREGVADRVASTAVAIAEPRSETIYDVIKRQTAAVELALPKHLKGNADAYVRSAQTLIKMTPGLAKCDPATILGALMTASQLGLELGPLQVAYMIPRGGKAQFQVGYRGYIELGYRSGLLADITAESVCANDDFKFDRATGELHHEWDLHEPRGAAYAYYAVANFKGGGRVFWVGGKDEIEKYRKRSTMPNGPAWTNDYDAMAKKTAIRRLEPYLPKSTSLSRAFVMDGAIATGLTADSVEVDTSYDYEAEAIDGEVVIDPSTGEINPDTANAGGLFQEEN